MSISRRPRSEPRRGGGTATGTDGRRRPFAQGDGLPVARRHHRKKEDNMRITPAHLAEDIPALQAMVDHHMEWVRQSPCPHASHATEHMHWLRNILFEALEGLLAIPDLDDFIRRDIENLLRKL